MNPNDILANNIPDLMGNFAPVQDELITDNLVIEGEIPNDVVGIYMRNGPNPAFPPIAYNFPFDGDGMIHAVAIHDGAAKYYNRYVETKGLLAERRAGHALYGGVMHPIYPDPKYVGIDGDPGPYKNGAFIHIIQHAKKYLALWEGGPAYEMTVDLKTVGEWKPDGKTPLGCSPHTRFDAKTGELWLIEYRLEPPYLMCYTIDKHGDLIRSIAIDKSHPTMMHDFVLTENYVIFIDSPVVFNLADPTNILSWQPHLGTKIGLLSRKNTTGAVTWITTEAFFVFHFANAYEHNKQLIIDYAHHTTFKINNNDKGANPPPRLYRMIINLETHSISQQCMDDRTIEFPRIHDSYNSYIHRFCYMPTRSNTKIRKSGDPPPIFNSLVKYDMQNNHQQVYDFGAHCEIGEAVFVPKTNAVIEDDGYLLLFVYDKLTNNSDVVLIPAQDLAVGPIARIKLPRRVPHGLHGSWFAGVTR